MYFHVLEVRCNQKTNPLGCFRCLTVSCERIQCDIVLSRVIKTHRSTADIDSIVQKMSPARDRKLSRHVMHKSRYTVMRNSFICSAMFALAVQGLIGEAYAQIAVIRAPGSGPMSKAQVAQIYLGSSFALRPVDLPQSSALRHAFYRIATDSDPVQVRSAWARITFTGRGEPPVELPDAASVKRAVASDPLAIGYIEASDVDRTVSVVLMLPRPSTGGH